MKNILRVTLLFLLTSPCLCAQTFISVYSQNFDALSTGVIAPGWTNFNSAAATVQTTGAYSSPNAFGGSTQPAQILYTSEASYKDTDMLFVQKIVSPTAGKNIGAILRSDAANNNQYLILPSSNPSGTLTIYWFKKVSGTFTQMGSTVTTALTLTTGEFLWMRCRVVSNTLYVRAWPDGTTEPSVWTATYTDGGSAITAAGINGLYVGQMSSTGAGAATIDNLTISASFGLSTSPSILATGSTGNTVTLTGTATSWTPGTPGSPTFTLSGGTGASITAQTVASATSAAITVNAGSAPGVLTVTDPSTGNTGSIAVGASIPVTDTNWQFSPYNTYSDGAGAMQTNNIRAGSTYAKWVDPGAYFRVGFVGTEAVLNVTVPAFTGTMEIWASYSVDGAPKQRISIPSAAQNIQLASGLTSGTHYIYFSISSSDPASDRWSGPGEFVQINSLAVDTSSAVPGGFITERPKNCYFLGDSITEGQRTLGISGTSASIADAQLTWAASMAQVLNCEYGQDGHGGQGWITASSDGTPALPSSWNFYWSGKSNLFSGKLSPVPDYVIVNQGTNDVGSVSSAVSTWIGSARAALGPTTPIHVVIPFGQFQAANITSAVNGSGDSFTTILNLGTAGSYGLNSFGTSSYRSYDGLHPNGYVSLSFGGWLAQDAAGLLQNRWTHF